MKSAALFVFHALSACSADIVRTEAVILFPIGRSIADGSTGWLIPIAIRVKKAERL